MSYEQSDFYCLNCGKKGIPCLRPQARRRGQFHRKKLYCPHCGNTVNHVECRTDEDAYVFKIAFENGEFREEAIISLKECAGNQVDL